MGLSIVGGIPLLAGILEFDSTVFRLSAIFYNSWNNISCKPKLTYMEEGLASSHCYMWVAVYSVYIEKEKILINQQPDEIVLNKNNLHRKF